MHVPTKNDGGLPVCTTELTMMLYAIGRLTFLTFIMILFPHSIYNKYTLPRYVRIYFPDMSVPDVSVGNPRYVSSRYIQNSFPDMSGSRYVVTR